MKHLLPATFRLSSPRLANCLITLLLGLHVALLGAGAFCTPTSLDPNPTHHSHPAASNAMLCKWACHVAQIASGASPASHWAALLLVLMFWPLKPVPTLAQPLPLHSFSPRGPPVLSVVHG